MMPVFLALTATLILLGVVIGRTIVAQRTARAEAIAEGDALLALSGLMGDLRDAEIGQRGFLLTGDRTYLNPYLDAQRTLDATLAIVRREVGDAGDDPQDGERLDRIETVARAKFAEMDRTITLSRAGLQDQAMALVRSDIGKLQMDAIRADISAMSAERAQGRRVAFARVAQLENRMLPMIVVLGAAILALVIAGFRTERSRARGAAAAEQAGRLREANARAELLARELNHREQILDAVVLSIVTLSARKQGETTEIVEDIRARIHALSRAHAASQGGADNDLAQLGEIVGQTMEPYADEHGTRVRIEGPTVHLPVRMVTPIGLIVHELATNAAKYGALSAADGRVAVDWRIVASDDQEIHLDWIETGGPPLTGQPQANGSAGFGSRMTSLAATQLGGTIERDWPETGAVVRLRFTLPRESKMP